MPLHAVLCLAIQKQSSAMQAQQLVSVPAVSKCSQKCLCIAFGAGKVQKVVLVHVSAEIAEPRQLWADPAVPAVATLTLQAQEEAPKKLCGAG